MLAPLGMAVLARQAISGGASQQTRDAQALGGLLGPEQQQIRQQGGLGDGLLGAVLETRTVTASPASAI